ncbi:hypothetical protein BS636_01575 [Acinetobacter sp. LoGeW2-3]|uniref:hypothetical protein n=1 Tax=Acinetobacter sp. LoGeW2-3 TaxID=1808001 RepID=UPI000C0598A4|nr:hypothetical protein [Acinetobacter sp. LoGeW2-3]ATO18451.1 hypothetical protein BS636_01575 [Acinetobacter sp. LoGeW2-3]
MYKKLSLFTLMMSCGLANASSPEAQENQISVNGSLTIVSDYVSRGLTKSLDNEGVTLQGSLSIGYDKFYATYWGSQIGFSFRELQGGEARSSDKFEHNFILGYIWDYKNVAFDLWDATYYYQGGDHLTSNEIGLTVTAPISEKGTIVSSTSVYLNDAYYMSKGDTYSSLSYVYKLTDATSLTLGVAGSYFTDRGKYEGHGVLDTQTDLTYRFSTIRADHSLNDNLGVFAQYYFGGYDRSDIKQPNKPVLGLTYSF